MAPTKPYMETQSKIASGKASKKNFKERMIASGKRSKNVEDSRGDTLGMKAETKQIFQDMMKEDSVRNKRLRDPKRMGPASKLQTDRDFFKHTEINKLSKKGPRPKV